MSRFGYLPVLSLIYYTLEKIIPVVSEMTEHPINDFILPGASGILVILSFIVAIVLEFSISFLECK